MKTYQVFEVTDFPEFQLGEAKEFETVLSMFGDTQTIKTTLRKTSPDIEGFEQYRIQSEVRVATFGLIRYFDNSLNQYVNRKFSEYLKPVDFSAYLLRSESIVAFQCPHKVAKEVQKHLVGETVRVGLNAKRIDFDRVRQHHDTFAGAWFRKVSANICAEGLHGTDVQIDPRFKELLKIAELSNLTLRYDYEAVHHNVMITRDCAVVFQQVYPNIEIELALLKSVKQAILANAWI